MLLKPFKGLWSHWRWLKPFEGLRSRLISMAVGRSWAGLGVGRKRFWRVVGVDESAKTRRKYNIAFRQRYIFIWMLIKKQFSISYDILGLLRYLLNKKVISTYLWRLLKKIKITDYVQNFTNFLLSTLQIVFKKPAFFFNFCCHHILYFCCHTCWQCL